MKMKPDKIMKSMFALSAVVIFGFMGYSLSDKQNTTIYDDNNNISQRTDEDIPKTTAESALERARAKALKEESTESKSKPKSFHNSSLKPNLESKGTKTYKGSKDATITNEFEIETGEFQTGSELDSGLSLDKINK